METDAMTDIGRRTILAGMAAALGLPLIPLARAAEAASSEAHAPLWLSARGDAEGNYFATGFGPSGRFAFDLPLPTRGHSFAVHPQRPEAIAFGRRPGEFALVIDLDAGREIRTIPAAAGFHFNGHGTFTADGARLFATETEIASGEGIVGIYDPADGYRRVGFFRSNGLDPHDIRLLADGRTLVVANGGLLTHPDAPGIKLNVATMRPNLTYLDARDGTKVSVLRLPDEMHRLSIRHLAIGRNGVVAAALQYEGPSGDLMPLVCLHRPGAAALETVEVPDEVLRGMRNYCGSAAVDAEGRVLAVSSPRGGVGLFWDLEANRPVGTARLTDGCGIAAAGAPGTFLFSSGVGGIAEVRPEDGERHRLASAAADAARWDNHIVSVNV